MWYTGGFQEQLKNSDKVRPQVEKWCLQPFKRHTSREVVSPMLQKTVKQVNSIVPLVRFTRVKHTIKKPAKIRCHVLNKLHI